jgi:hypothetical protein
MKTATMNPDHERVETRAEALADRRNILRTVLDIPSMLEKRSLRWFLILLLMVIFGMATGALFYFQKQLMVVQGENVKLRDQLTNYLVVANTATTGALDRNSTALSENSRVMHRMEQQLDRLAARLGGGQ